MRDKKSRTREWQTNECVVEGVGETVESGYNLHLTFVISVGSVGQEQIKRRRDGRP